MFCALRYFCHVRMRLQRGLSCHYSHEVRHEGLGCVSVVINVFTLPRLQQRVHKAFCVEGVGFIQNLDKNTLSSVCVCENVGLQADHPLLLQVFIVWN